MHQVILIGVREGVQHLEAVKNLAALFKTTPEQVERLLATSDFILKKGITEKVAGKYKAAIEAAGGTCRVELEASQKPSLEVDLPGSTPIQKNTSKVNQKMTTCATCGQAIAKSADNCPKCGAENEWTDPRRTELVSYLQSHGNDLVSEPWEFYGDRFSVWGSTKASLNPLFGTTEIKSFRVDFSGEVPIWESDDERFWRPVKEYVVGKNTSVSTQAGQASVKPDRPEKRPIVLIGSIVGISLLVLVVLVTFDNLPHRTASANSRANATADRSANPERYLEHLVSTNSMVLGTKDGETAPSYLITFSNGYMLSGRPGHDPVYSGQVFKGGSPNATCVSFSYQSVGAAQDFLCVAVRDFGAYDSVAVKDTALKKGDLFISQQVEAGSFGRGFTEIYRAQVK